MSGRTQVEEALRPEIERVRQGTRPRPYDPESEDPGAFGRRVARELFAEYLVGRGAR